MLIDEIKTGRNPMSHPRGTILVTYGTVISWDNFMSAGPWIIYLFILFPLMYRLRCEHCRTCMHVYVKVIGS